MEQCTILKAMVAMSGYSSTSRVSSNRATTAHVDTRHFPVRASAAELLANTKKKDDVIRIRDPMKNWSSFANGYLS